MTSLLLGAFLLLATGQGLNFFSAKQDAEIGSELARAAQQSLPLVREANLTGYFTAIGQRVTRTASASMGRYRFHIVNSKEINSLGFPGGEIYVNRGLIDIASNDDEIAAILAHEAGHVSARHGTAKLSRQLLMQSPLSIATGLPTMDGLKEQLMRLGISLGIDAPFLRYSRDHELEASLAALRLLADARFDPNALRTLLEKINEIGTGDGAGLPAFLFNHPQSVTMPPQIAEQIDLLASPQRRARASAGFRTFRAALQKLAYPVAEVVTPPAIDTIPNVFTHAQDYYRLGYPADWQVTRTGPNGAIITPVAGVQTLREDISHGVIFDLFDLSIANRTLTLQEATNRLIVFLRQRNQDPKKPDDSLRIVPGAEVPTLVSDEPGLRTVMIGKSRATGSFEVVWVVTRVYYQSLFYMVFVAPEDEFSTYQPIFEQMIGSVRLR
jgi:Zn-dependent protease with chaperone function